MRAGIGMQSPTEAFLNQLRYPRVSAGYVGAKSVTGTVNSQYYADLACRGWAVSKDELQLFPQRVPVLGFFDELLAVETEIFQSGFTAVRKLIADQLLNAFRPHSENSEFQSNSLDLAARFGLSELIGKLPEQKFDQRMALGHFKREVYAIMMQRALGLPRGLHHLSKLSEEVSEPLLRSLILARIIVEKARHSEPVGLDSATCAAEIKQSLDSLRPSSAVELGWLSMIYRALPMAEGILKEEAREFLEKSVEYACSIEPGCAQTRLAKADLLLTTYQSFAKWSLSVGDENAAETYLLQMNETDPADSVGFSELGLFYFRNNEFNKSFEAFRSAVDLGPPALALNLFFLGKTNLALGDAQSAENNFKRGIAVDPTGVSHFLELIEIYDRTGRSKESSNLKRSVFSNPDLFEQLSAEEQRSLRYA